MTPLAHRLAKLLTLPLAKRGGTWSDADNSAYLRECLTDIHCFEISPVLMLITELCDRAYHMDDDRQRDDTFGKYLFLPAPRTWIEHRGLNGPKRTGYLLIESDDKSQADILLFVEDDAWLIAEIYLSGGDDGFSRHYRMNNDLPAPLKDAVNPLMSVVMFALVLINSPRVFGRRQIMPHRGLEHRLTRAFGPGKFPLHAWTEINLEVSKPPEIDDGEPHEAHLTGRRALHFCRKHIRIRLGKIEYVSSHWRGDPAIGIKRSRYVVQP